MDFHTLLSAARNNSCSEIPAGWTQGRATFGGLVAAMLHQQIEAALEKAPGDATEDTPLRSLTISFVAPAKAGALECRAEVLRAGRSAVQIEARASQGDQVISAALASFGKPRESAIVVPPAPAPQFTSPEDCEALPYIEGLVPEFTQHFDYRIASGAMPYSGSEEAQIGGWIRFKQSAGTATTGHLLALIDAWPPAVLSMLKDLVPASSLTWTVELLPVAHEAALEAESEAELEAESGSNFDSGDWWQYLAEVEQAEDGYGFIQARLWDQQGRLVALSRQTVSVFG